MARRCAFLGMLVGAFAQGPEDGYSREQLQPLTNFRLCDFAAFLEKRSHSHDFPRQQHRRTIAPTLRFSIKFSSCQTSLPQLALQSRLLQDSLRMAGCVRRLLSKTVAATPVAQRALKNWLHVPLDWRFPSLVLCRSTGAQHTN